MERGGVGMGRGDADEATTASAVYFISMET